MCVKYLHCRNFIHRDLKLSCLYVDDGLTMTIGGFGEATECRKDERLTQVAGNEANMAPEMLLAKKGGGYKFGVDVWAAAVVIVHLLTGKHPFWDAN